MTLTQCAATAATGSLIAKFFALFLIAFCLISPLSGRLYTPPSQIHLLAIQAEKESFISLELALSPSARIETTLLIHTISGFEECIGRGSLSSDRNSLIFTLQNLQGKPLPENVEIATLRVTDPGLQFQRLYSVRTASGGVMIILSDL